jgi:hypothetical protein
LSCCYQVYFYSLARLYIRTLTSSSTTKSSALTLTSPTPMVPAATKLENNGDFATQAALSLTRASQTNNFVSSKAYYDISFTTATAGAIKTIEIDRFANLKGSRTPALVVNGIYDEMIPIRNSYWLGENLPNESF